MNWALWWLYTTTAFFLDLTPGPAVLLVLASSLGGGLRGGIATILGILSANTLYFALSATSIGALLASSANVFLVAKWAGAAYLFYLGFRSLFSKNNLLLPRGTANPMAASQRFGVAFLTQASNPKAIIFFGAFLPQFIDPKLPLVRQMTLMGVTNTVLEFFVLLGYALVAARAAALTGRPRFAVWTNRAAGFLLISAAIGIALLRRG